MTAEPQTIYVDNEGNVLKSAAEATNGAVQLSGDAAIEYLKTGKSTYLPASAQKDRAKTDKDAAEEAADKAEDAADRAEDAEDNVLKSTAPAVKAHPPVANKARRASSNK